MYSIQIWYSEAEGGIALSSIGSICGLSLISLGFQGASVTHISVTCRCCRQWAQYSGPAVHSIVSVLKGRKNRQDFAYPIPGRGGELSLYMRGSWALGVGMESGRHLNGRAVSTFLLYRNSRSPGICSSVELWKAQNGMVAMRDR